MTVSLAQAHNRINTLLDLTNAELSKATAGKKAADSREAFHLAIRAAALKEALACFQDPEPTK